MTAKKGLKIAALAGIPIHVSWSWWFFAALIMVVFRPTFSQALPDASTAWTWAVAAFFVLIMFSTVLIHELAHALAAISFRWKVNEVTLNFWGGATIYEHSSTGKEQTPLRSLTVAIVGPISNLVIAGAAWLLLQVLLDPSGTAQVLLTITVWTNLLIGIFNLLPGHPLDGGRVVESSVWAATGSRARGMRAAGWSGRVIVLLLFVGGVLVPLVQTGELSPFTLVIIVLLGAMLWQAASAAIKTAEAQLLAERLTTIELMTPVQTVLSHASISELIPLLNGSGPGREYQQLPIAVLDLNEHNGHEVLIGIVDSGALAAVPRSAWHLPVSTVSRTVNPGARVHSSDTVEHLFTTFMEFPNELIAVIEIGRAHV